MNRVYAVLIFYCVFLNTISAQKYNFKNFSVGEGLTQSEIYAICEDQRGNLWFGSMGGGIIKYDGYTFLNYREEDGLAGNFVYSIIEDKAGRLWFGTENGVCTYNGNGFNAIDDTGGIPKTGIRTIIEDNIGTIWIGTSDNGLYIHDGKTFKQVLLDTNKPKLGIYCLYQDIDSGMWIGTDEGAYKLLQNKIERFTKREGLAANIIRSICNDDKGNVWFATYGGGISCLSDKKFINYGVYDGLCNNTVYAAFNDGNGNLWFGTAHGVSRYNGISFKTYRVKSALASNIVVCINNDSSKNLWFGTSGGGVSKFDNERFIHFTENEKMGRWIYSLIQAPNGNILFGSSQGGLTVFDGADFSTLKGEGFTDSRVISLHYTVDSTLWCGTLDDGAYKFKRRGFQHFSKANGLHSNTITSITSDTAGNIWFSSLDSGICVYSKHADSIYALDKNKGLASNTIYSVVADKIGNIWAGTSDSGLIKISIVATDSLIIKIKNYTESDGLTSNSIKSIAIDSLNNIYVGTAGEGINRYDGTDFVNLTKENGLRSDNIYLLLFDNDFNLWAGTEQGVDKISYNSDFTIKEYKHYGRNEGFSGIEVYRNSCFKDNSGNLWFGTVNGAILYNPNEDVAINVPPKTHITGLRLFYEKIQNTKYCDSVSSWYPLPINLTLPYNQNNLTFEFVGIYHRNPQAVRYKWKLEGVDEDWSPALNQREVTYSNLTPGDYIFKVNSCNEYNIWNAEPAVLRFQILLPFWKKWWFMAGALFLFVSIIWRIIYIRFRRIKAKNRIQQEKLEMEKSIIELEQEAARLQMNPHFIFNSLNSIQGFIATNEAFLAKRYLAKFARLMRLILENAREEFIPLENEIEILDNYLELEKLSTNHKFDFEILVNKSINPEITEIPPMMIQPFVENAIIHGIKNMKGEGLIKLEFKSYNSLIICEITDNGIGRKKAQEIKNTVPSKHKSTGISVTKKRLEQFSIQTGMKAGFEIVDLFSGEGTPSGTKVIISVPFESY